LPSRTAKTSDTPRIKQDKESRMQRKVSGAWHPFCLVVVSG
jgi:hypothetical protein